MTEDSKTRAVRPVYGMLVIILLIRGGYRGKRVYRSMGALTPLPHFIKNRFVIVDDDINAFRLERLHLRVGDVTTDLEDHVVLVVKTSHLSTRVSL